MCRFLSALCLVAPALVIAAPAQSQSAPSCQYVLGFQTLNSMDPSDTGSCTDNQAFAANGDAQQHTTTGRMAWRKADNWTAFTNGNWTWINGPNGLAERLNTQRFSWEANPDVLPLADASAGSTAQPPAPVSPPPAPAARRTFGDGTFMVGKDIQPGTYRTRSGTSGCYWSRLAGFSGGIGDILANDNADDNAIVTIAPTDKGFQSVGCGTWTNDLSPVTASTTAQFRGGTYFVGRDVAPGTWKSSGQPGCYWARLSTFGGSIGGILANDNTDTPAIVTIGAGDKGFQSKGCGTWQRAG